LGGSFNGFHSAGSLVSFKEIYGKVDLNFNVVRGFLLIVEFSQFGLGFSVGPRFKIVFKSLNRFFESEHSVGKGLESFGFFFVGSDEIFEEFFIGRGSSSDFFGLLNSIFSGGEI
jgi:hypothetical protein